MGRFNANSGKMLYAKKGATVIYYKYEDLASSEEGFSVKDGDAVGVYHSSIGLPSGELIHLVGWPSDVKRPIRYVKAELCEWVSYKAAAGSDPAGSFATSFYDPLTNRTKGATQNSDNSLLYLGGILATVVFLKFIRPHQQ